MDPLHVRSCSDSSSRNLSSAYSHLSPTSVLTRRTSGISKSLTLTELEFEELKGLRDLGFEFSEEDRKDPNLVSIVPGLRRLAGRNEDVVVQRPYLSEAWEVMEKNEAILEKTLVINGRLSDQLMKDQIKLWARSVASAIR